MERNEYDRERSAFRLRNPPPEFASVTMRCRAAWLQTRLDAALGCLPRPRHADPATPTTPPHGEWYEENQAWLTQIAQMRIAQLHPDQGPPRKGAA